jgi:hypothetical protein
MCLCVIYLSGHSVCSGGQLAASLGRLHICVSGQTIICVRLTDVQQSVFMCVVLSVVMLFACKLTYLLCVWCIYVCGPARYHFGNTLFEASKALPASTSFASPPHEIALDLLDPTTRVGMLLWAFHELAVAHRLATSISPAQQHQHQRLQQQPQKTPLQQHRYLNSIRCAMIEVLIDIHRLGMKYSCLCVLACGSWIQIQSFCPWLIGVRVACGCGETSQALQCLRSFKSSSLR